MGRQPEVLVEVRRVEGGTGQCVELERRVPEAFRVPTGEDQLGDVSACSSAVSSPMTEL